MANKDLGWHLEKIESLLENGGGGGGSLPTPPTENGKYILTVTVVDDNIVYA